MLPQEPERALPGFSPRDGDRLPTIVLSSARAAIRYALVSMQDNRDVSRAETLFAVLLGLISGVVTPLVPAYIGEWLDSEAAFLAGLAFTWSIYAYVACRIAPRGFDSAWPGLVALTVPLSSMVVISTQWPEISAGGTLLVAAWLASGVVGLVAGVAVATRQPRRPSAKAMVERPRVPHRAPSRGWRVLGWCLLALWAGAWAVEHAMQSRKDLVFHQFMAVVMGTVALFAGYRMWEEVKGWWRTRR